MGFHWSYVLLSAATVLATLGYVYVSYRVWQLQSAVEQERKRVELVLVWEFRPEHNVSTKVPLRVCNASPNGCVIRKVEIRATAEGSKWATASAEVPGSRIAAPFSEISVPLETPFRKLMHELRIGPNLQVAVEFQFAVDFEALGAIGVFTSGRYKGVFWLGDLRQVEISRQP